MPVDAAFCHIVATLTSELRVPCWDADIDIALHSIISHALSTEEKVRRPQRVDSWFSDPWPIWPVGELARGPHDARDPWPTWPMTHDPSDHQFSGPWPTWLIWPIWPLVNWPVIHMTLEIHDPRDPWPIWLISELMYDPRDPWPSRSMTYVTHDPWPIWPVIELTLDPHDPRDPWPTWPMTHDPSVNWPMTHVTHPQLSTHLTHDPLSPLVGLHCYTVSVVRCRSYTFDVVAVSPVTVFRLSRSDNVPVKCV